MTLDDTCSSGHCRFSYRVVLLLQMHAEGNAFAVLLAVL